MKKLSLAFASLVGISTLLANGGAWQTGVPGTDSASAISRKNLQQPLTWRRRPESRTRSFLVIAHDLREN
jgi:hypothetical protein